MVKRHVSPVFAPLSAAFAALVFFAPQPAHALVRLVCKSGCPYSTIQKAITASKPGDIIKVARGRYREKILVQRSKRFTIRGGWNRTFTSRKLNPSLTIIDGDKNLDGIGEGTVFTVNAGAGETIKATLETLTIANGVSDSGGGFNISSSDGGLAVLSMKNAYISDNRGNSGGAVAVRAGTASTTRLNLTNTIMTDNRAFQGAGIYARTDGAGANILVTLGNSTMADNILGDNGAGIWGEAGSGGAASFTIRNTIIQGNGLVSKLAEDGEIYFYSGLDSSVTATSSHSDIGVVILDSSSEGVVSFTSDGTDLANADPVYVNRGTGNYRLNSDSPCVDAGENLGAPAVDFEGNPRPIGANVDIGADEAVAKAYSQVTLLSPVGGEAIPAGQTWEITWGAPAEAVTFDVAYSLDDGANWVPIADGVTGRHLAWDVPALAEDGDVVVRAVGYRADTSLVGVSTSPASAVIILARVKFPFNGEQLPAGSRCLIRWDVFDTVRPVETIELAYSTDGGATWDAIGTLAATDDNYGWDMPSFVSLSTQGKIMVTAKDSTGTLATAVNWGYLTFVPAP